jgi:hypothetical protein
METLPIQFGIKYILLRLNRAGSASLLHGFLKKIRVFGIGNSAVVEMY